jgi:bacillithiol system protein YtxJ
MSADNRGMAQPLSDEAAAESLVGSAEPAWIFKHSVSCGVSAAAHGELERYLAGHPGERAGVIVIQSHRALSNWLAQRLGRTHQSPQVFLVRSGKVLWTASHWSITAEAMAEAMAKAASAA